MESLGELISLRELSKRLKLSPNEVRRLRDEEGLPVYPIGRRVQRVLVPEVLEWLASRRRCSTLSHPAS
jgi:hypothetical protein